MRGPVTSEGDGRAMQAAQRAISSPLLEDSTVHGARGGIINVTGGPDLSLVEVNEASCVIQEAAHEDANIIFGAVVDPNMEGKVKITVIATGFDRPGAAMGFNPAARPTPRQPRAARSAGRAGGRPPVDLQNYTAGRQESVEKVAAAGGGGSRISISRRPTL